MRTGRPRCHLHLTPTSASWIDQVERFLATLTRKQIRRGTHRRTRQLEARMGQGPVNEKGGIRLPCHPRASVLIMQ
jgi:hypothetical protein